MTDNVINSRNGKKLSDNHFILSPRSISKVSNKELIYSQYSDISLLSLGE